MKTYKLISNDIEMTDQSGKVSIVPMDVDNLDYQEYLIWVSQGNVAEELNAWKGLREQAYPPYTDYLDGVVKGDQEQIDKYIADCLAVKAQYPKGNN